VLLNVVDGGTGSRLRRSPFGLTAQMGGKTGTTNDNSDGWFMGFTPTIVAGTWVGGDERDIHFSSMANGQGAAAALPIFGKFMTKVYADKSLNYKQSDKFVFPAGIDLCEGNDLFIPSNSGYSSANTETVEESMEGVFD
ncbi:MAG: penicillin-binding protein, partial [Muribaculaceae bacterium]|nr:penicillin-binding protein [Muribaculaceae bacterium]